MINLVSINEPMRLNWVKANQRLDAGRWRAATCSQQCSLEHRSCAIPGIRINVMDAVGTSLLTTRKNVKARFLTRKVMMEYCDAPEPVLPLPGWPPVFLACERISNFDPIFAFFDSTL